MCCQILLKHTACSGTTVTDGMITLLMNCYIYSFCYCKPELLLLGLWCTSFIAYLVVLEGCCVLVWISVSDTISPSISSACGHRGLHPSSSWAAQETLATEDRWHQQGAAEGNGSEVSCPACCLSDNHLYGNWPQLNPQGYRGLGFVY